MTTPFYSTPERCAAFIAEARSWLGTPFSENAAVKGKLGGVDCVHYAAEVNWTCGAIARVDIPIMPIEWVRSWHHHHAESRLLAFFSQDVIRSRLRRVSPDDKPMVGDVAVMRYGKTEHHVGLWCGHEILHVTTQAGVISASTHNPEITGKIRCYYRFY